MTIETQSGFGTGFLVQANGTLVTNYHVIKDAQQIKVTLESGEVYRAAYLLRTDEEKDIAILRIEGADLPVLTLGNSDANATKVGEDVMAIGTPEGLEQTVSTGIVSGRRLMPPGYTLLQTTAPISHGSSGGPLLNRAGQSVGIMTSFLAEGQNLNFAVPINYVRGMLDVLALSPSLPARLIFDRVRAVIKATLTITASSPTMTYGDPVPAITPSYSGFVNGDNVSVVTTAPTCTTTYGSRTSTSNAGSSPETVCSGGVAANYNLSYITGKVMVNKAPLTVTASSHTILYGDLSPTITPQYSGFVNGDSTAVLTTAPVCKAAYIMIGGAGSSPETTCSGGVAANYSFSYVPGTLTVKIADVPTTPKPESSAGNKVSSKKATLYVYRSKRLAGSVFSPSVYCNDVELARMDNGRYFIAQLDPGKYILRSNDGSVINIQLEAGKEYFMRVDIVSIRGVWKNPRGRLVLSTPDQGGLEIKQLQPLDASKVRDHGRVLLQKPKD